MWNERNGAVGVRGNRIVNTPFLVLCTGVWSSHETIGHHMLNIFCPHGLWDIWKSKIIPNQSLSSLEVLFLSYCALYQKLHNLYCTNKLSFSKWIMKLNKRITFFYLHFNLTQLQCDSPKSCNVILPNLYCNNIVSSISFKILLIVKICTRTISLIS
jgi:hypothetical protein